jgi:hypothetical protein
MLCLWKFNLVATELSYTITNRSGRLLYWLAWYCALTHACNERHDWSSSYTKQTLLITRRGVNSFWIQWWLQGEPFQKQALKNNSRALRNLIPPLARSRDSSSSIRVATGYGLKGRGSIPGKGKILLRAPQWPDRLWGPPSLQSNRYRG